MPLAGPAPAVAEVRVDGGAVGVAVDRGTAGVDEAAAHDAAAEVEELGDATLVAVEDDRDEIGGVVAGDLIEDEEIAGPRRLGGGVEAVRLGGPGQELGARGGGDRRAEGARPRGHGGERVARVAPADELAQIGHRAERRLCGSPVRCGARRAGGLWRSSAGDSRVGVGVGATIGGCIVAPRRCGRCARIGGACGSGSAVDVDAALVQLGVGLAAELRGGAGLALGVDAALGLRSGSRSSSSRDEAGGLAAETTRIGAAVTARIGLVG